MNKQWAVERARQREQLRLLAGSVESVSESLAEALRLIADALEQLDEAKSDAD